MKYFDNNFSFSTSNLGLCSSNCSSAFIFKQKLSCGLNIIVIEFVNIVIWCKRKTHIWLLHFWCLLNLIFFLLLLLCNRFLLFKLFHLCQLLLKFYHLVLSLFKLLGDLITLFMGDIFSLFSLLCYFLILKQNILIFDLLLLHFSKLWLHGFFGLRKFIYLFH